MLILSLGENCMPGMVLSRFGITNTWSTPYTYARSNMEQCLLWEKEEYKDFLEMKYIMKKEDSSFTDVYRNMKYNEINRNRYDRSVNYGFEFTHHDIVSNKEHYESYKRKINRMIELKKSKEEILFLYYHRYVDHDNYEAILDLCRQFVDDFYSMDRKCNIAVIVQVIDNHRRVVYQNFGKVHLFEFHTTEVWRGVEPGYVSAEIDDDLFVDFFKILSNKKLIPDSSFLEKYSPSLSFLLKDDRYAFCLKQKMNQNKSKYFYLWGNGKYGKIIREYLINHGIKIDGIIDKNSDKMDDNDSGIPFVSLADVMEPAYIVVAINDDDTVREIVEQVDQLNRNIKIQSYRELAL